MGTRIGFRLVRLALMIEGQEGVTWDDWVALASACEEHGVDAYIPDNHFRQRDPRFAGVAKILETPKGDAKSAAT